MSEENNYKVVSAIVTIAAFSSRYFDIYTVKEAKIRVKRIVARGVDVSGTEFFTFKLYYGNKLVFPEEGAVNIFNVKREYDVDIPYYRGDVIKGWAYNNASASRTLNVDVFYEEVKE